MSADDLIDFVESVSGDAHLAVEERLGDGFVRLKTSTISAASRTSSSKCSGTPATRMRRVSFSRQVARAA